MTFGEDGMPIDYQLGNPRLIIYNSAGAQIIDSAIPGVGLTSFSYTFSEEEADSISITFELTNVKQFDEVAFRKYQSISVAWGYLNFMRPPIRVLITESSQTYRNSGLSISISGSDNFSVFTKAKSPLLLKAENLKGYLQNMQDMGFVIEALKAQNNDKFSIYRDGKYYSVDGILAPYADNLTDFYIAEEAVGNTTPTTQEERDRLANFRNNPANRKKPLDVQIQKVLEMKLMGKSHLQWIKEGFTTAEEKREAERQEALNKTTKIINTKVKSDKFWGIPDNAVAEGQNPKEVLENTLNQSEEDWNVTGHGNKVVLHTRNLMHSPTREFTWGAEPGYLLEVSCGTDSQYSGSDSVFSKLAINPETGALTAKDFLDTKTQLQDVTTPQQYALLSREIQATAQMLASDEAKTLPGVYDNKGIIQQGVMRTPDVSMASSDVDEDNPNRLATDAYGNPIRAVDNTNMMIPGYVVAMPVFDNLAERVDEVIKNLKVGEGGSKLKMSAKIIGDPHIACSENVLIKGISKAYEGKYHITKCTHSLGRDGYTVSLDMYPVHLSSSSVATVSSTSTKEEVNDKLKKVNTQEKNILNIPFIPSGNPLTDKLPQDVYNLVWEDEKGTLHTTKVLSRGTPDDVLYRACRMGYLKSLDVLLPNWKKLVKVW